MGICCMAQETQTGALYQTRGVRWEGGSKGRGYIYIPMADSCWGLIENNKILLNNYFQLKNR